MSDTYTNSNGVVPLKVIPDVVVFQSPHGFASDNVTSQCPLFYTCGCECAQNVGRKTNLDARPPCQHKFLCLVIQERRVPQAVGFTAQECHCFCCRIFPCLKST